jgi:quercetin dioxygenase-like cupin family protein
VTDRWSVASLDELEWDRGTALIRRQLGIRAFGVNAMRGAAAGDRVIGEHEEVVEGHEELYLVLRGHATFTVEGEEIDAPPGTLVFVQPEAVRSAVAAEPDTVVLGIGGEPGKPFEPSSWEEWGPLGMPELLDAHRYEEAAERYAGLLERFPEHPGVFFNLACLLSLAGRRDEALERLGRAIELHPKMAEYAREDADFDPIRDDPRFPR